MKDHNCGLVHERARETVAASGDVSTAIRLARLVAAGRETEVRTHRSRSRKPAPGFNGADVHQRGESTNAGDRHEPPRDGVGLGTPGNLTIQLLELLFQSVERSDQHLQDPACAL